MHGIIHSIKQKIIKTNIFQRVTAYLHHQKRRKELDQEFASVISKYIDVEAEGFGTSSTPSEYIWVCWWQGYDGMTPLVRECVERIKRFNSEKKVILITDDNVNEYVRFPEVIMKKYVEGVITKTNMSDLLRANLLAKYGGCWMDATLYIFGAVPERFYNCPVYTGRYIRNGKDQNISRNRWTSYFMMARYPGNILFCFLRDFWNVYWENHDTLTEYLMIDYALDLAYRRIPSIRRELNQVGLNGCGNDVWALLSALSEPYDEKWFQNLGNANWMQKLTYKIEATVQEMASDPQNSIYKRLFLDMRKFNE